MLDTRRVKDEVSPAVAVSTSLFWQTYYSREEGRVEGGGFLLIWPSPHPPNLYFRMRAMSTIIDLSTTYVSVLWPNSMNYDQFVNQDITRTFFCYVTIKSKISAEKSRCDLWKASIIKGKVSKCLWHLHKSISMLCINCMI